jgi:anti-sigma factor RsiW
MSEPCCERIDDYLSRDLDPLEENAFRTHLTACQTCRALVEQHERLVATLSEAARVLFPPPEGLVARTHIRLKRTRRVKAIGWTLSAAAAAIALWATALSSQKTVPVEQPLTAPVETIAAARAMHVPGVHVSFANEPRLLIVPEKTESDDVTFVWVYRNERSAQ